MSSFDSNQSPIPAADYHLHTPLCRHAEGWPGEYAEMALERGLEEIGFSDHNPMAGEFDDWRMADSDFPRYLELVNEVQEQYADRLKIKLGLECDYLEGQEPWVEELAGRANFDYLIGSVHYLEPGWAVDDPDPKWESRWIGAVEEIWEKYWALYRQCASSGLFDFLAHPDLVKKFGHRPEGDLRRYYEPAIEAIAEAGVAVEISTAGLRKPCVEMYPSREFLDLAFQANIPIVISSDAHRPQEVGADFETAIQLAKDVGYTQTLRFHNRKRSFVDLS